MGRWTNKVKNISSEVLTGLTKSILNLNSEQRTADITDNIYSVSSGSASSGKIIEKIIDRDDFSTGLLKIVQKSCSDLLIEPQIVIDNLLSIDDEQDVVDGYVTVEQLNGFIKLWLKDGIRNVSGKYSK